MKSFEELAYQLDRIERMVQCGWGALLTEEEAAEYLRVSIRYIRHLRAANKLAFVGIGGTTKHGCVRYRLKDLEQGAAGSNPVAPTTYKTLLTPAT